MATDTKERPETPIMEKDNYNLLCVGIGGTGVIRASMILGWAALNEGFKVRTAETHGMSQRGGSVSSFLRFGKSLEGPFMIEGDVDVLLAFEISEALRNLAFVNKDTHIIVSKNVVIPPSVLTHRMLKIDEEKCIGCGNCLAHCVPSQVFSGTNMAKKGFTLIRGLTRSIRNGLSVVLEPCTGCEYCIIDNVCPFDAISAYNEWEYPPVEEIEKDLRVASSNVIVVDADRIAIDAGNILAANVVMLGVLAGIERFPLSIETMKKTVESFVPKKALEVNMKAFDEGVQIGKEAKRD
ncbi:MAG TPA: 2-oxoacid:acceptor oxidoreductase family protein [Candidatus Lokiarchaeia archaeon]|nr:2-oxoacid:acceptor oxidoreductase family protein [Candidatus Lokiarchaeia archaeon]